MARYVPDPSGDWLAAVEPGVLLIVPAARADDLIAMRPALSTDDPTGAVLDRLSANGVSTAPEFVLAVRSATRARVIVRGGLVVRAGGANLGGADVATWSEHLVDLGDSPLIVETGRADAAATELPIESGIVGASRVSAWASDEREPASSTDDAAEAASPSNTSPTADASAALPETSAGEVTIVPIEDTVVGVSRPAAPLPPSRPRAASEAKTVGHESSGASNVSGDTIASVATLVPTPALSGDHDGLTVTGADLHQLRQRRAAREHELTGDTNEAPQPATLPLISLRMPDGALEPIAHEVIIGRSPSATKVSGGRIPKLLTIGVGDPDISRSHVRVALEGGTVVVTDLNSRNGTVVIAPGRPPVRVRSGEPTPVLVDTVIDLGGGWSLQVVSA